MGTSKEPIDRLLSRPDLEEMSKQLSKDNLMNARRQYQNLLEYLRKLKQEYPDKMIERKGKPGTRKAESFKDSIHDKDTDALYTVLIITKAKEEEWNELYYLLNARYLFQKLQKDNSHLPTHQSVQRDMTPHTTKADGHGAKAPTTSSDKKPMGAVLGSELNFPTLQNVEGPLSSQSYTTGMGSDSGMSKNISNLQKTHHGFPVEPRKEKPEQTTKTGKSEIQQTIKPGKPEKQQTDGDANSPGMSKNISDPPKTYQRFPEESRRQKSDQSTRKHENQQIDSRYGDTINVECEVERPIFQLLSWKKSKEAEKEYQRLLRDHKVVFKDRPIVQTNKTWETSTDFDDITEEQKEKSPVLFGYLQTAFEKITDKSQDLVKRALSEFIILTGASYDLPRDKKGKGAIAVASNFPKKDVPSASVGDVNKLSKSEYANLKPIEKALQKLKLTCKNMSHWRDAHGQYCYLIKQDENFKRRFPDKHRELQVFMADPEEYSFVPCQALFNMLHQLPKTDPEYKKTWEELFFLITSEQQHIIAEHCGQPFKSVYKKEIDSVLIPRKSYEDLQNELVEKIKQIDELTSRLSKFASQQLTAGNPNIADLSDKHRPTKIGEFYSELYDNEWSEAFEVIKPLVYPNATEDPDTEYFEEVLRILKNILMAAYEFSAERTEKHLKDIKLTLLGTITDQEKGEAKGTEYDRFVTEHAMKFRKEAAAYAINMASKVFKRDGLQKFQKSDDPKLLAYVDKCVELTWYMRIQDPPMHLHCLQEKETISKTEFAFHGRKGKTTLVCVWPALLLFEGGHLVTKGHVLPEE